MSGYQGVNSLQTLIVTKEKLRAISVNKITWRTLFLLVGGNSCTQLRTLCTEKGARFFPPTWQLCVIVKQGALIIMDPSYSNPRSADASDPSASYDAWPTLPSTRPESHSRCSPCCRRRLSWSAVSVLEIVLMVVTVAYYFFLPKKYFKQILPAGSGNDTTEITELAEWTLRMVGSMVCVQVSVSKY